MPSLKDGTVSGDLLPGILRVVEPDVLGLMLAQPADASGSELAFGNFLFREVIDISDLIPLMLSLLAEATAPTLPAASASATSEFSLADGGDVPAGTRRAMTLTIFYDDDKLTSARAFL